MIHQPSVWYLTDEQLDKGLGLEPPINCLAVGMKKQSTASQRCNTPLERGIEILLFYNMMIERWLIE